MFFSRKQMPAVVDLVINITYTQYTLNSPLGKTDLRKSWFMAVYRIIIESYTRLPLATLKYFSWLPCPHAFYSFPLLREREGTMLMQQVKIIGFIVNARLNLIH